MKRSQHTSIIGNIWIVASILHSDFWMSLAIFIYATALLVVSMIQQSKGN